MCPFRDAYFVNNTRACQRKLLNCPASPAATNLRGLVMPNDRKRPLGAVSVGHGRHLRWCGTRPQAPPVPQAVAGLVHHSDRGGECVIESSGFGGRNTPADCRCRMTGDSEVMSPSPVSGLQTIRSEYGRKTNCSSHRRALLNAKRTILNLGTATSLPLRVRCLEPEGGRANQFVDKNA